MIENQIKKMKELSLRDKEEVEIEDIFTKIKQSFKKNESTLIKHFTSDTGASIDISLLINVFEPDVLNIYGNVSFPYFNKYGRVSSNMCPLGIVGLKVDKRISLVNYLEIIKVALETRNSLIIQPFRNSKTLELLIVLINDVLIQTPDFNEILLVDEKTNIDSEQELDGLIYVGIKENFNTLSFEKNKIYLGIGEYELYVDEELDEELIKKIKARDVKVYYKNEKENIYDKINREGGNYCSAIMSGNKTEIKKFISNVKSSYILTNMSPTMITNANLTPEQLLKRKSVLIFE